MTDAIDCPQVNAKRFFCLECDAEETEVQDYIRDNPGCAGTDGECCVDKLRGEALTFRNQGVTAMWDLFDEDPLPAAQHPTKSNANRRFFCYSATIRYLGGTGGRYKMPECVELHIEELYPRPCDVAPVGFQA